IRLSPASNHRRSSAGGVVMNRPGEPIDLDAAEAWLRALGQRLGLERDREPAPNGPPLGDDGTGNTAWLRQALATPRDPGDEALQAERAELAASIADDHERVIAL